MKPLVLLAWILATAAGWTFGWAASRPDPPGAMSSAAAPVRGAPIRSVPRAETTAGGVAPAPVRDGAEIEFERLEFDDYDPPGLRESATPLGPEDFPASARLLDGARLSIVGFSQALQISEGTARQLMVSRYPPGCCFGMVPVFDEWILVELEEPADLVELGSIVQASGTLVVGEALLPSGVVECLYRLTDATVEDY